MYSQGVSLRQRNGKKNDGLIAGQPVEEYKGNKISSTRTTLSFDNLCIADLILGLERRFLSETESNILHHYHHLFK